MPESVYKIVELVGTSSESREKAATNAIYKAAGSLHYCCIAEVSAMNININDGKIESYRTKEKVSFMFDGHHVKITTDLKNLLQGMEEQLSFCKEYGKKNEARHQFSTV
ncbi:dodecin family protein [uncultured Sunxiuqinia sp.]|uniref:dodecin family protein n=1 Tax=uncultured Sunxiuqinia sp. TaxID=1573825 RepID=UPI002AA67240|nr:dodecin family protein [uncultured Sunxiuqinia sp.]